jgi:drug/metabolite transporter (DMT)-like permease
MPTLRQPTRGARPASQTLYMSLALLFSLLWASAFMGVKVGLRSSPPFFLMGLRFLVAGTVLIAVARLRGLPLPRTRQDWFRLAALGFLNNAAYLGLSAIALRSLSGGMGAVLASTNPLMLALVAPLFLRERLTPTRMMGFGVAFLSVLFIMYVRVGASEPLGAMALVLLANALMVAGTVLFKRWAPSQHLVVVNGVQLLTASVLLLVPSLAFESIGAVHWGGSFLGAIAFLALGVSCGAMLIWFWLLRAGDAARASAFFFLNPVLGLFLGALLLGEPLRGLDFAGTAGVALGIYLVQRGSPQAQASAPAAVTYAE